MIRYRWSATPPLQRAAQYCLPDSSSLRGRGPWNWTQCGGWTYATLVWTHPDHHAWSEWRQGIGDYEVSHVLPIPEFELEHWENPDHGLPYAELISGVKVPVKPLSFEGVSIDWDGTAGHPVTPYGKACVAMLERVASGEDISASDEQLIALIRWSLSYGLRMTRECMHLFGLITDADVSTIMEVIADNPKA